MLSKKNMLVLAVGTAVVGLLSFAQTASSDGGRGHYKAGGNWIGKSPGGVVWTAFHAPLDPEAHSVASSVKYQSYGAEFAGLVAAYGGDTVSDFKGEGKMINRDTLKWTLVGYAQKAQKDADPLEIKAIMLASGTWKYTDPDHAVLNYTITVYPAAADADGDGMPDSLDSAHLTIPDVMDTAQRVPILK
jgi:hypothetical protein